MPSGEEGVGPSFDTITVKPNESVTLNTGDGFFRVRQLGLAKPSDWDAAAVSTEGEHLEYNNNTNFPVYVQYKLTSRKYMYNCSKGDETMHPPFEQERVEIGKTLSVSGTTGWVKVVSITPISPESPQVFY